MSKNDQTTYRLDRHFSKLLLVKIDTDFTVSGRLITRKKLPQNAGKFGRISWQKAAVLE